jgi:ArsR family transcriptional regulator, arsenate/arsenite/antimonite-responsive transcriptional repressor
MEIEKMLHRTFKALADPTRLRILNLLMQAPFCVCDFGTVLLLPQPLISRHLAYLKNAGLVQDHRQGMRVQYSISLNEQGLENFLRHVLSLDPTCQEDLRRWKQTDNEVDSLEDRIRSADLVIN